MKTKTAARAAKGKKVRPKDDSDMKEQRFQCKLIQWAELVSAIETLRRRFLAAQKNDVIDGVHVDCLNECCDQMRDEMHCAVPTD